MAMDAVGNCYMMGSYGDYVGGTATFGNSTITSYGPFDIFIARYNSNGLLTGIVSVGGTGEDRGYALAVDNANHVFSTGFFQESATFGAYTLQCSNTPYNGDKFISRLSGTIMAAESPFENSTSVSLSPNPAHYQVQLTNLFQPNHCSNSLGQEVLLHKLSSSTTEAMLTLQGISLGLYTLQIHSANGVQSRKLVIE